MKNMIRIPPNERVLWKGKPDTKASVFEGFFNPLLIFALIWLLIDGTAIAVSYKSMGAVEVAFFALHLFPVYLYIFGCITAGLKAKNTRYVLTDRALYFQHGIFTVQTEREPLNEVTHTGIHRGIIDQMFGLGDVVCVYYHDTHTISNIKDYEKVSDMIAEVSQDSYTDTMYPNDKRPDTNHGYNTRYTKY
jgi:membrane protein YdbS with pleckstrin-like domain